MSHELNILVESRRKEILSQVSEILSTLPMVAFHLSEGSQLEQNAQAGKKCPDIIVLDEGTDGGEIVTRLLQLQEQFVQSSIFVISPDTSPKNIVRLMKAGASEFISNPVTANNLIDAVEEFRIRRMNAGKVAEGKICSFISSKGGLGSSVLAVNSAAALAQQQGHTMSLCDMSLESGDLSVMLDTMPDLTIVDLCRNIHRLDVSLFRGAITRHKTGLDFLAAPHNPSDVRDIKVEHVQQILVLARKLYDYTFLDCPAMNLNDSTLASLNLSDRIFVITDLSVTAIRNASRLCKHLENLGIDKSRIEVVINRYIKGSTISIVEVEKNLNRDVFWAFPNDFAEIVSSINCGLPLVKKNSSAMFSRNILDFVKKLQNPDVNGDYRGIKGVFGKAI
jgi:pilus assembly protein CpaE